MRPRIRQSNRAPAMATPTLHDVIEALQHCRGLTVRRRRDLRSAVVRVAALLGEDPRTVMLNVPVISAKLAKLDRVAAGTSAKTLQNACRIHRRGEGDRIAAEPPARQSFN